MKEIMEFLFMALGITALFVIPKLAYLYGHEKGKNETLQSQCEQLRGDIYDLKILIKEEVKKNDKGNH